MEGPLSRLATIGYEGASLPDFIATLQLSGVELLLDVRAVATSRRKGFSKTALATAVTAAGIEYVHLPELGDPKEGRDAARAGDYATFKKIFQKHLGSKEGQGGLRTLKELLQDAVVCLMCYERDPESCHRGLVASALTNGKTFKVEHLGVREGLAHDGFGRTKTGKSSRPR